MRYSLNRWNWNSNSVPLEWCSTFLLFENSSHLSYCPTYDTSKSHIQNATIFTSCISFFLVELFLQLFLSSSNSFECGARLIKNCVLFCSVKLDSVEELLVDINKSLSELLDFKGSFDKYELIKGKQFLLLLFRE